MDPLFHNLLHSEVFQSWQFDTWFATFVDKYTLDDIAGVLDYPPAAVFSSKHASSLSARDRRQRQKELCVKGTFSSEGMHYVIHDIAMTRTEVGHLLRGSFDFGVQQLVLFRCG